MSLNSINTNTGALVALQSLNATNSQLQTAQNQISTGLRVAGAEDDGSIYAIAQGQRSQVSALGAVTDSLNRASSVLDVAVTAGQTISDLLNQLKSKALEASDTSLSTSDRSAINSDFKSLIGQIKNQVSNASFDGANLIATGGATIYALSGPSTGNKLSLAAQSLALGGANLTVTAGSSFHHRDPGLHPADADQHLDHQRQRRGGQAGHRSQLGHHQPRLRVQPERYADHGHRQPGGTPTWRPRARPLQALQTKQQLGVQALSIANSSSSNPAQPVPRLIKSTAAAAREGEKPPRAAVVSGHS